LVLDFTHIVDNFLRDFTLNVLSNLIEEHLNDVIAFLHEGVVKVLTLDQEHAHSDFKRHLLSDLVNRVLILGDFLKEDSSVVRLALLVIEEFLNLVLLVEEVFEFIVHVNDFAGDL